MASWRLLLAVGILAAAGPGTQSLNRTIVENAVAQLTDEDKAVYIADFLINHKTLFDKLLRIFVAGSGPIDMFIKSPGTILGPYFLDRIPSVLEIPEFQAALSIIDEEFSRVNVSDVSSCRHTPPTADQLARAYLKRADYWTMARRILAEAVCQSNHTLF